MKSTRYDFGKRRYILTERSLTQDEYKTLTKLLASFPHASYTEEWPNAFRHLSTEGVPQELLALAANAYDSLGNTMLGIAAEYGKDISAMERLIDMGAEINKCDHNMNKLPLYWAINNKLSYADKHSRDAAAAVKCLLDNGAKLDIASYGNKTLLEYARIRKFVAAAEIIEEHKKNIRSLYTLCFFKVKSMVEEGVITRKAVDNYFPNAIDVPIRLSNYIRK